MAGKLTVGWKMTRDTSGERPGWYQTDYDVVLRRSKYEVATIGTVIMEKRPKRRVEWFAIADCTGLGTFRTRTEAVAAVKDAARAVLSRALEEGVL